MVLGLPDGITACLFDLDGVLTDTASLHEKAWKRTFEAHGHPFSHDDYDVHVDGKPRADGIRDFLASRGVTPTPEELASIGDEKNALVQQLIDEGVDPFPGSVRYLEAVKHLKRAVVSSSHNCRAVLNAAGLHGFDTIVDGNVKGLRGKPAPDTFLEAARRLDTPPDQCAVFEDALAGVQAGRACGYVVGVNRANQREELHSHGADIVVDDLADLL